MFLNWYGLSELHCIMMHCYSILYSSSPSPSLMKAMAIDDPDIQPYLDISHDSEKNNNKENENNNEVSINILFWGTCSLTRV